MCLFRATAQVAMPSNASNVIHFNVCGNARFVCHAWWSEYGGDDDVHGHPIPHVGVAVAVHGGDTPPPCNEAQPECHDPVTGGSICCSAPCEVLALGPPSVQLLEPSNPSSGGISMVHAPANLSSHDKFYNDDPYGEQCSMTYNINCDRNRTRGHGWLGVGVTRGGGVE